jgi:methionyl-tRNA formyltransferase
MTGGPAAPQLRVAFLGNAPWSVPSLKAVAASGHPLVLVATRDARPAGRGRALRRTPVAEASDLLELPLIETPTVKHGVGFDALVASSPDVLAVVAYGEILPAAVLAVPGILPVNVHFSLLPRWRGAAPVQRAIMAGDDATGVTTMRITAGLDEGPVLLRSETRISPDEDAGSLGGRLAEIGGALLVDTLDGLASRSLVERPQDADSATYAARPSPQERRIDWSRTPRDVVRRIRALAPVPGAVTSLRGRNLKVLRAAVASEDADGAGSLHGQLVEAGPRLVVRADGGAVELLELAPEGRKRMTGAEFVRGHRPRPGDLLT